MYSFNLFSSLPILAIADSLKAETMRRSLIAVTASFLTIATVSVSASQFAIPNPQTPTKPISDPSFPQPGFGLSPDRISGPDLGNGMTLVDALTLERKAGLWWDYARDVSSVVRSACHQVFSGLNEPCPNENEDGEIAGDRFSSDDIIGSSGYCDHISATETVRFGSGRV